ncbi:MAG: C40 family peptidase [Bacteroidales bacterium]|nr:C40 family peptidase [Bacteroidales bacterium]MBN2818952.1 C40 family peptidase [Bacteroidales bacterium]
MKKRGLCISFLRLNPPEEQLIKKSEEVLGTPWVYTGITPEKGFDCSGFVLWTFGQFGYEFPYKTKLLAKSGKPVKPAKIKPADLVCFGSSEYNPSSLIHVGLVYSVTPDSVMMIHCGTSNGVSIVPLNSGYWSERVFFILEVF